MSTPCSGCSASLDCPSDEAFPYTLTPLALFPWVINCPEGVDCSSALSVTMNCCGSPTTINIPAGTSAADRITLLNQLIQQCLFLQNVCDNGDGPSDPDAPPSPPSSTYYFSHAQTANLECSNDGTYTLEIVAGSFMASTQREADRLALAEVQKQARASEFCLYPPCLCVCADVAATLNMGISGGSGPFSYSILTGTLPTGLAITVIGGILRVAGTPTVAGNSSISLRVFDSLGGYLTKALNFYILKITTTTLPNYQTGVAYSQQIAAMGGTGNYVFSIAAGALPDGLSLSPSGLISGIPTGSSDATFTVAILDSGLNQASYCTRNLEIDETAVTVALGPGMVPAFSTASNRVIGGFSEFPSSGTGPIATRRVPEMTATQVLNLGINGGAAWCSANNKFYHGCSQVSAVDGGLVRVIDPLTSTTSVINVPGADGQVGRMSFYHPITGSILVAVSAPNCFLEINPADDSIVGYIAGVTPLDFDYCTSNDCLYFSNAGGIYKIDAGGTVTTIFTLANFTTAYGSPTPGAGFGSLVYVSSIDRVVFLIYYPGGGYFFAWQIDPATDTPTPYAAAVGGSYMHYSPEFDRIILQATNTGTPSGLPGILGSYQVDFTLVKSLGFNGVTTDFMYAPKGCYCSSDSKVALSVLTGPPGGRFWDLQFYGVSDLT